MKADLLHNTPAFLPDKLNYKRNIHVYLLGATHMDENILTQILHFSPSKDGSL